MATADQIEQAAKRRARIPDTVRRSIEGKGYPPTITELADALDVDRETVKADLAVLVEAGYLEVDKGITRGIRLAGHRVVLVEEV